MQGYILGIRPVRNEDLLVTLLTAEKVLTLYRFYGVRHPTINLGYKIDFTVEISARTTIARLRNVLHLGFDWIYDRERLSTWQQFVRLFEPHLRGVLEIESFYFNLLEEAAAAWGKRDPKRLAVELYLKLLEHEGRLHNPERCFLCHGMLTDQIALARAFLPAHPTCLGRRGFQQAQVDELLRERRTILFSDEELKILWGLLGQGL
ncbi:MAG: recombination protein RecO [Campylobacterales bacterium]